MKQLFVSAVLFVVAIAVHAQMDVSVGPNAGFGHAWIKGGEGDNEYKPAGNFGLSLIYSANEHIGVGGDLKYSIEGGEREIGNVDYKLRLNYIRLPFKFIYFFNDYGDRIRPKVSIGPSIGFLVGGKQKVGSSELDAKDYFKSIDFGALLNAGLHVRLIANTWLTADLNYYNGFTDISEDDQKTKNRNLGINVGLAFGIAHNK